MTTWKKDLDTRRRAGTGPRTANEFNVYRAIACETGRLGWTVNHVEGDPHPDHPTLVELTGLSPRSVRTAIKGLAALGMITIERQRDGEGRQGPSLFRLTCDAVEVAK